MMSQEDIEQQQQLLATHRRTLEHLLRQAAQYGGEVFAPPVTAKGIAEARANIQRTKRVLRDWGEVVEDHPDDELQDSIHISSGASPKHKIIQEWQRVEQHIKENTFVFPFYTRESFDILHNAIVRHLPSIANKEITIVVAANIHADGKLPSFSCTIRNSLKEDLGELILSRVDANWNVLDLKPPESDVVSLMSLTSHEKAFIEGVEDRHIRKQLIQETLDTKNKLFRKYDQRKRDALYREIERFLITLCRERIRLGSIDC